VSMFRKNIDIIAEILKATDKEHGKTSIMYRTDLSYTGLCKYLNFVCFCGLVDVVSKKYVLTIKGRSFLEKYDSIRKRSFFEESKMVLNGELKTVKNLCDLMIN